ncbi:hypothetical protein SAMN05444004_11088 [Jannaschia faecimaris]|uniref:Peptidase MA superfamily protein n=1 Tax=Jannaschia faecimaris TaxID=1244108 RepID=A0A1H3S3A8_9RHOB|nr:hypothetical protein [Jannaschia faecimaris]SDZ32098.1 hypothetical protein SAMN05444004_11088 [Jannaschia faecimaris]
MRRIRLLSLVIVLVSLGLLPFPRHVLFPGWAGLNYVSDGVWMEATAGDSERFVEELTWAEAQVADWWGEVPDRPRILVCGSLKCDSALNGPGPYAQAYGRHLLIVHARLGLEDPELRRAILAHELSHIIVASRVSIPAYLRGDMPAWLNEGLAVLASDDPRFNLTPGLCDMLVEEPLPEGMRDWGHLAGEGNRPIYQAAACRARAWLENNDLADI